MFDSVAAAVPILIVNNRNFISKLRSVRQLFELKFYIM